MAGTWGLARTAERGSDGSSALLAAPGQITSSLLGRPLRAPRTREGDGAKLCQAGTVWGAVRTRGRGAGGSAPPACSAGSSCICRCPVFPARRPLPGLHIRPPEKLKRPRSLGPFWGRAGAHWEGSDCCPGEPDVQPGGARRSPGGLAIAHGRLGGPGWGPGSAFRHIPSDTEAAPHEAVTDPKPAWAGDGLRACQERRLSLGPSRGDGQRPGILAKLRPGGQTRTHLPRCLGFLPLHGDTPDASAGSAREGR